MSVAPAIEVVDAVKKFGSFTAVDHVSLSVAPGQVVGLLGANGAGKTTIMRMVLGLLRPDSGAVLLLGQPPSKATRRRLGYVPQGLGLYEDLTVAENLNFVAQAYGIDKVAPTDVGVAAAADTTVAAASLGLRRRTAFAAALSHAPELLILDEPTSGVDPLARAQLWETIGEAAARGAAVLVSTHYMEEAQNCDDLIVMRDGRVVATGSVSEIIGSRSVVVVSADDLDAALKVLDAAGIDTVRTADSLRVIHAHVDTVELTMSAGHVVADVKTAPATFEEAFVQLVTTTNEV
jgi:ABC-2 type transport system ATP-binding protein/ribosome-dependent ATPase